MGQDLGFEPGWNGLEDISGSRRIRSVPSGPGPSSHPHHPGSFHDLGPSSHPLHPGSDHVAIRRHAALPVQEPSLLPSFAPFSPSLGKIIWQCYSELAGGAENTFASPLEVKVFCPYLCTTPQGRDGRTATETREGKGKQSCKFAGHVDHRKRATKII